MSILNAITSGAGGVSLSGDTSGNLTIQSAGNTVCTITATGANAGIQVASWAAPAFSAYTNAAQTISSANTWTLLNYTVKEFDTGGAFNNTASGNAYSFTPQVAGYYLIVGSYNIQTGSSFEQIVALYKNGVAYKFMCDIIPSNTRNCTGSAIVYCNGSTDYIQLYAYVGSAGQGINTAQTATFFQGSLIRSA